MSSISMIARSLVLFLRTTEAQPSMIDARIRIKPVSFWYIPCFLFLLLNTIEENLTFFGNDIFLFKNITATSFTLLNEINDKFNNVNIIFIFNDEGNKDKDKDDTSEHEYNCKEYVSVKKMEKDFCQSS